MPPAKKPRKSAKSSKNQYSAELSPSQLVLGIAILLIFGLACFLFGVLVGKFDPSLNDRVVRVQDSEQLAKTSAVPETRSSQPAVTTTPVKTEPAPAKSTPVSKPVEEKTMVVKREPVDSPSKPTKPATSIPDSATVTTTDLPPDELVTPAPVPTEEPAPPAIDVPEGTPPANAAIVTAQATTKPETVTPTEPEKPTQPTGPYWSVQLGAFKSGQNAETEKNRLEKLIPYKIETHKPANSLWTKVLVGRYATKAEADAFRKKLVQSYKVNEPALYERK